MITFKALSFKKCEKKLLKILPSFESKSSRPFDKKIETKETFFNLKLLNPNIIKIDSFSKKKKIIELNLVYLLFEFTFWIVRSFFVVERLLKRYENWLDN